MKETSGSNGLVTINYPRYVYSHQLFLCYIWYIGGFPSLHRQGIDFVFDLGSIGMG